MGERQNGQSWLFEADFNRAVKVQTTDQRITSDTGLLLLREADHRLGLCEHLADQLIDPRRPDRIHCELVELLGKHGGANTWTSIQCEPAVRIFRCS